MEVKETVGIEQSAGLIDARLMLAAFSRVGATHFDVTPKGLTDGKLRFRRKVPLLVLYRELPDLLSTSRRRKESVILRPRGDDVSFIQLDDIKEPVLDQLSHYACCVIETSHGNFQAFVAVTGLTPANVEHVRRRLIDQVGADKCASGAVRLAGTLNVKEIHRETDGSFPIVRMVSSSCRKALSMGDLLAADLISPKSDQAVGLSMTDLRLKTPKRRIAPSYDKAQQSVRRKEDGTVDRSAVDFHYAIVCLDWQFSPEATIKLLEQHSAKAAERADDYVERTVARALTVITERKRRRRKPLKVTSPSKYSKSNRK